MALRANAAPHGQERSQPLAAWLVPWDEASPESLDPCLRELNPFVFAFDGASQPFLAAPELLRRALARRGAGTRIVPVIVNDLKDGRTTTPKSVELLTRTLNSDELVEKHVQALMTRVWSDEFDGLELDYERIPPALYDGFATLVERLAGELHARKKTLAVDVEVQPLLARGQPAKDLWPRLAKSADAIKVMMYYERGAFSPEPGPGSSLPWFEKTARRAAELVPSDRLSLAISLAGTDWTLPYPRDPVQRRVQRLHYGEVVALMRKTGAEPSWSERWGAPSFEYESGGRRHVVWFEDARSIAAKAEAAGAAGAGVGLWYLGRERPDLNKLGSCRR
jgi:spore germination protein YaaH